MEDRKVYISISSATIIKVVLWVAFLFLLYYIKDIVLVVLAAIVIASAIEPVANWLTARKIRRLPAVILIYFVLGLVLAILFIFFVPSILREGINYLNNLPPNFNLADLWSPLSGFLGSDVDISGNTISISSLLSGSEDAIAGTGAGAFKTASVIFGGALSFILMIVLSFYLAVQEDGVGSFLRLISPLKHHTYITDLWKRSQKKIGFWMQGQLLLGLIVGVLTYLGLMVLGVEHALLLAVIAGIFELIPIFGPILSAVPAVLIAFGDSGTTLALLVAGLYLIIQQFENHLLYPLVVRKIVGISPMVVILALVIGGKLAGFLGVILSVPISAALMEFVSDIEKGKQAARKIAEV